MIYIRGIDSFKKFCKINNIDSCIFERPELRLVHQDLPEELYYWTLLFDGDNFRMSQTILKDLIKMEVFLPNDRKIYEYLFLLLDYRIHNCPKIVYDRKSLEEYFMAMRIHHLCLSEEEKEYIGCHTLTIVYQEGDFWDLMGTLTPYKLRKTCKILNDRLTKFRNDLH